MSDILFSVFPNENFVDIGFYQYGWEQCEPSHSFWTCRQKSLYLSLCNIRNRNFNGQRFFRQYDKLSSKKRQGFMLFPNQINTYIADQDLHGNIPGSNLTDSVQRDCCLPPDSVRDHPVIMLVQKIFAMK